MLLQLRDYIKQSRLVSMQQLSRAFQSEEQALQPMLDIWMTKGCIRTVQDKSPCKKRCASSSCKINIPIYFQWVGDKRDVGCG